MAFFGYRIPDNRHACARGNGVSELQIDHGPGYRVYYMKRGRVVVILLCGGNKDSQGHDIAVAKAIAAQWKGSTI
ncbi:type II toxin-antitoxin system RelE/ParE family toxin [Burkholderia gladioli]|uniref:type II toxin-antitoxin system RelE/ParE family toxin n=1 Tax=Burkholderia gladioli TaxID=28095 RepID=UPI0016415C9A|nr:type II toxin-antitoxin system RelE/ParE family toxin [Burkholderia gladioli]